MSELLRRQPSRRAFLGGLSIVSSRALGRAATPPSDRVTVGIIASGGRAVFETRQYPSFDNAVITALCDAQESRRLSAKAALEKQYADQGRPNRGIRMYRDFRELLAQKDIDAVYIASPDHWHVSMLIPALKAGKHVHCEKPLGVSIEQDLAALKAVRKYGKVFQYGAELRAFPEAKKGIELVLNGRIGKVRKIYAVSPPSATGGSATPVIPVPPGFDYDMWLGPAPLKPFCADRCLQGSNGRNAIYYVADYSLGNIANWAAHPLDQVQRWADAVGREDPPVLYEGSGEFPTSGLFDTACQWNVRCTWADGLVMDFMDSNTYHDLPDAPHPAHVWGRDASGADITRMPNGSVFVGTEGWVVINYGKVLTRPASLMDSVIGPNEIQAASSALEGIPEGLPKGFQQTLTAGHHQNWIRAIRTGSPVVDGIESAFRSDMVSQLAELAIRTGRPVRWDPKERTIAGNEAARRMIRRPMRKPWQVG
ncbi:MAG: Gfo/Idh/MocA family oxidoreductase [Bryobacterales bacterium]|nr:Gfo/Idh/MocA family oxidoreductase [Bryobacterales bacterium]